MPKLNNAGTNARYRAATGQANAGPRRAPSRARAAAWGLVAVLASTAVLAVPAGAQSSLWKEIMAEGQEEFAENCASCHGADGKGGGELGQKLFKKPLDLTTIAARHGGEFPFERVFEIIAGEKPVEGHDTMHMPEYAKRMRKDDFKPGFHEAHLRIVELTHYLESIQAK